MNNFWPDVEIPTVFVNSTSGENYIDRGVSAYNFGEVQLIKALIGKIADCCENSRILLLTPYQAQLQLLQRHLPDIKSSTIHAIQVRRLLSSN